MNNLNFQAIILVGLVMFFFHRYLSDIYEEIKRTNKNLENIEKDLSNIRKKIESGAENNKYIHDIWLSVAEAGKEETKRKEERRVEEMVRDINKYKDGVDKIKS